MNSKMESNFTAMWVSFFTAAGIPSDVSATYALTFTENRIQNDMLLDLNKEYLRDMGIIRMGDVIAILRHAKQVHENAARDKVLSTTMPCNKVPVAAVTGRATVTQVASRNRKRHIGEIESNTPVQRTSAASRILEHYTRNVPTPESPPAPPVQPKRKTIDAGMDTDLGIKKARMIRFTEPTQPIVKEGVSKTVFARLGNEAKVVTNAPAKPIFSRLGSKTETTPDRVIPIQKDALKYEGILKSPPQTKPAKKVVITTSKNVRKISCTMRADEVPISAKEKLALPKTQAKSVKFSNHVQYKEIEPIKKPLVKKTVVFNKPERRLSMPNPNTNISNDGIKARLGKNVNNLTITSNVFNRLGV